MSPLGKMQIIVNPRAGRGAIERAWPGIEGMLREAGLQPDVRFTERTGHATRLAREAMASGARFLVAVGGDGTVNEVVNGMMADDGPVDREAILGIVPSGSGCDFARTFGIPQDPTTAARHLLGETLWGRLDVARVRYRGFDGTQGSRWYVNIAEAGIGADVVVAASRMPRWLGGRAYRLAALKGVLTFRPRAARVTMHGRNARRSKGDAPLIDVSHDGTVTMIVVANCQFFGGGLRVAPRAIPSDQMLDVLIGEGTKGEAVRALKKMPRGEHVPSKTITEYLADTVSIESDEPLWVEADGEALGTTPATFDLVPDAIALKV